jgi:hypothetical protein
MSDGQLTMTAEKTSADFYQLAGRRLNWDLSDYHPLLGQRRDNYLGRGGYLPGQAPPGATLVPSIGYAHTTQIREAYDGDFLLILADDDTWAQGGALGIFNRSLGPMEMGRNDPGEVHSLTIVDGPTGRAGDASGAYRSPWPLPDGHVLASFAADVDVGIDAPIAWDLVDVDPTTGARTILVTGLLPGAPSIVEAVLCVPRPSPIPFRRPAPAIPATTDLAVVHFPDLPLLATLLDDNDHQGRDVASLRGAKRVRFFTQGSPPASCASPTDPSCASSMAAPLGVFEARTDLGSTAIHDDGSVLVRLPTLEPLFIELLDAQGNVLFRQREELQFGPLESIGLGVPEASFDSLCATCHGAVSGRPLDVHLDVDAITASSTTEAHSAGPVDLE